MNPDESGSGSGGGCEGGCGLAVSPLLIFLTGESESGSGSCLGGGRCGGRL